MQRPFVDYLIARDGPPPRSGLVYDYLLAGDGVWLAADNSALRVRAPVAPAEIRGLPALGGACELRHGRLPFAIWEACVAVARGVAEQRQEILLLVIHGPGGYRLILPEDQRAGATRIVYTPPVLAVGEALALALHSHHTMPAFFSATDDADEQDLGLYAVVGRLLGDRPEVIVRAGAYGHWLPVPWEAVFAGERGPFRDVAFDPPRRDDEPGAGWRRCAPASAAMAVRGPPSRRGRGGWCRGGCPVRCAPCSSRLGRHRAPASRPREGRDSPAMARRATVRGHELSTRDRRGGAATRASRGATNWEGPHELHRRSTRRRATDTGAPTGARPRSCSSAAAGPARSWPSAWRAS